MKIAEKTIGRDHRTLVIAEIGVNHDGSVERALQLVDLAATCGADAIKLQLFRAKSLMHASSSFAEYQAQRCDDANPIAMLERYELSCAELKQIVSHARDRKLLAIATPFSLSDIATARELHLDAIKIASPDIVNTPLLREAAKLNLPMLVSTGAATIGEIDLFAMHKFPTYALLHCISSYPTPTEQANLCWISELISRYHVPVGYSDHTTDVHSGALAVASGACIIEKHLTFDTTASGPDHSASADGQALAQYVNLIRLAESMRGRQGKRVLPIENDVRRVSRQSLVLTRDLAPGAAITRDDLTTQRPGTGIPAADIDRVIGRRTAHGLARGTMLTWDLFAESSAA